MKVGELKKLLSNIDDDYDVELSISDEDKSNNIWVSFKDIDVGVEVYMDVCVISGGLDDKLSNYKGYGGDK